ncbi:MAG: thiamine pyrophosphate-binding protein [Lautropia sp.]|nr:thiamine pyrophosphate-binding protein [Lautropia sp.]
MTYNVGNYLLDRLASLGVDQLFGVPGDFNLQFLDDVLAHPSMNWIGNANELNAGYAADGYARIRGLGALLTTYGVGELSAINATAGSYAENVPVIHIVGAPSLAAQSTHLRMHHTLNDGDFQHFMRMAREVSAAVVALQPATAASDIDHVIRHAVLHHKPGYIMLPVDVAASAARPPTEPLNVNLRISSPEVIEEFRAAATAFLRHKKTLVLADIMTERLGATADLRNLVESARLPFATMVWGKSILDETSPQYAGIYIGGLSADSTRAAVEEAEALILSGVQFTDTTSGLYTHKIDPARTISLHAEQSQIGRKIFAPLALKDALRVVREAALAAAVQPAHHRPPVTAASVPAPSDSPLTQQDVWNIIPQYLDTRNNVVVEMGTSFFGMAQQSFPAQTRFIGMPLWGSIGYSLPALLGAALADREARGVLFIGDGSAQLTIQELGSIFRHRLTPVIFLINNDGYTIERSIHGFDAAYNDIAPYDWQRIPAAFGGTDDTVLALRATTVRELLHACATAREIRDKAVFIEIKTAKDDMPQLLRDFGAMAAAINRKS